jgi:dihydrofolate reductase
MNMGKVVTGFSMSLDGFVAGPGDDVQQVFAWYSSGDTEYRFPGGRIVGDKNVVVGSPTIVQQCLKAGLLDEIHIDLAPVLLGDGVRLFDHLDTVPIQLESTRVIEAPGATHLTYSVAR